MILGLVPARGGSKGIKRKNLKPLLGKPLILWTIEAARRSRILDYTVVSTEDEEIAATAIKSGVDVLGRPPELANDDATTLSVMQHVIKEIPADVIVLLQPTSPIRGDIIDATLREFFRQKCDTLATGYYTTHGEWTNQHSPRQKQKPYFHDDGCVYIFKREVIESGRWQGDKPYRMEIPGIYNTEIDTVTDFWRVEGILQHVPY